MEMRRNCRGDRLLRCACQYRRLGLGNPALDPFAAVDRMRGASRTHADALDLLALYETVRTLRLLGKDETLQIFCEVYLTPFVRHPAKNEISLRVLRVALAHHCDPRTVYRHLHTVRRLFETLAARQ